MGLPVEPTDVGSHHELLRHVVVLLHIVGFAITFGAWTAEAAAKRFRFTRTMDYGLLLSLLTGLALAAPWPAGIELNYPKIGVKLVILVVIGGVLLVDPQQLVHGG